MRRTSLPHVLSKRIPGILLASLFLGGAPFAAPAAQACGYHSPEAMALGILNWIYPKALHVRTAVWQAEHAGILPPRESQQLRDPFAYRKMVTRLQTLGARLLTPQGEAEPVSVTAVLLDSMLWVRFAAAAEGYIVRPHVDGPEQGDVVVVTDGKVIQALVDGSLDAAQAETYGLLRLYGPPDLHDKVRSVLVGAALVEQPAPNTFDVKTEDAR